jgi:hypothetical protein
LKSLNKKKNLSGINLLSRNKTKKQTKIHKTPESTLQKSLFRMTIHARALEHLSSNNSLVELEKLQLDQMILSGLFLVALLLEAMVSTFGLTGPGSGSTVEVCTLQSDKMAIL